MIAAFLVAFEAAPDSNNVIFIDLGLVPRAFQAPFAAVVSAVRIVK